MPTSTSEMLQTTRRPTSTGRLSAGSEVFRIHCMPTGTLVRWTTRRRHPPTSECLHVTRRGCGGLREGVGEVTEVVALRNGVVRAKSPRTPVLRHVRGAEELVHDGEAEVLVP